MVSISETQAGHDINIAVQQIGTVYYIHPAELSTSYDAIVQNFLEYYVGKPGRPQPFGGREQDLIALDHWLEDKQAPSYALVAVPAGRGKSALLCQWVTLLESRTDAPHIIFFPISLRFETHLESVAFSALAARAGDIFGEKVATTPDARQYRGLFADFLRRPPQDGKSLLVVLDGLDEAANWTIGVDVFPTNAPEHLKVLIAARPLAGDVGPQGWLNRLGWNEADQTQLIPLDNLTKEGVKDVLRQMGNPLDKLAVDFDIVDVLYRLTEGDPLLLRLYVDALRVHKEHVPLFRAEDIRNLEPGLTGFFKGWEKEQQKLWGDKISMKDKGVRGLLNACASAIGPLSNDDVLAIDPNSFEGDTFLLEEAAKDLSRFIIGDGVKVGYVFSHSRLREYFAARLTEQQHRAWQDRFVKYGKDTLETLKRKKFIPKKTPPYVLQYYSAHLKNTDSPPEAFYELICQPWARAWLEFDGTYAGFLNDVGHAWKIAEDRNAFDIQFLCALCYSSIASLSKNISADLLASAVKEKVLSIRQGLILIQQHSDFYEGFAKIRKFSEELGDDQLKEGFELALNMGGWLPLWAPIMVAISNLPTTNGPSKSREYASLAPSQSWEPSRYHLSDNYFLFQAMAMAGAFIHTGNNLFADNLLKVDINHAVLITTPLALIVPHLPKISQQETFMKVLEIAQSDQNDDSRAITLTSLIPLLPEALRQQPLIETLEIAGYSKDDSVRVTALISLSAYLSAELLTKALEMAQNIGDESQRAQVLIALAPHLSRDLLSRALGVAQNIKYVRDRIEALTALAIHLPEPLRQQNLMKELEATQNIEHEHNKAYALTTLAPHLPEPLREETLMKALQIAQNIRDGNNRAYMLTTLAPHLLEPLRQQTLMQALEAAQNIQDESDIARTLIDLASHLPEPLRQETAMKALGIAQNIEGESDRAQVLTALVPMLPEACRQETLVKALAAVQNIQYETWKIRELTTLAPYLPANLLNKALEEAQSIRDESDRAQELTTLLPYLPTDLTNKAFEAAQSIQDAYHRTQALTALVPYLPADLLYKAFMAAQDIQELYNRTKILTALVPHLPDDLLIKMLEAVQNIQSRYRVAELMTALVPRLPADLLEKAVEVAQSVQDRSDRDRILTALVPRLPADLIDKVLEEAQNLRYENQKAELLIAIVPLLPEALREETAMKALEAARGIQFEDYKIRVLATLVPLLPKTLGQEIVMDSFDAAQNIQNENNRARTLTALAPLLPKVLQQEALMKALDAAQKIPNEMQKIKVLTTVLPCLPTNLFYQAFEAVQNIRDSQNESGKERLLIDLVRRLPANPPVDLFDKALDAAQSIQYEMYRMNVLIALVPNLPVDLFDKALDAAQSIQYDEWKIPVLTALVPRLPANLLDKALDIVRGIRDDALYTQTLSMLPLYVSREAQDELISEMIELFEASLEDNKIRKNILFTLNNQLGFSRSVKDECIKKIIRRSSKLSRREFLQLIPDMYNLICSTLPESDHRTLAEQFALATLNVAEWWP